MIEERRGLPRGSNVGTQLRARRARQAREEIARTAEAAAAVTGARCVPQAAQLALPSAEGWFAAMGWQPFPFQREVWQAVAAGRSGLLHATTGSGKTYAVWFGLLNRALAGEVRGGGLRLLWLTPMRALAADTAAALEAPLAQLGLDWSVGVRTGDTDTGERARQSRRLPEALVTTPESLSLLLTRADSPQLLSDVELVVVDEWHELMGNKRGVQVQLALARLRMLVRQRAVQRAEVPRLEAGGGAGISTRVSEVPAEPGAPASAPVERGERAWTGALAPARKLRLRSGGCRRHWAIPSTRWKSCSRAARGRSCAVPCRRTSPSTHCCRTSRAAFPGAGISASRCWIR